MGELMNESEAAELLRLTPNALRKWRQLRKGPRFIKLSERCVRYDRRDLEHWLTSRQVQPHSEPSAQAATA